MKFKTSNASQFTQYYDEKSFWDKIISITKKSSHKLVYTALLLYYVLISQNTPIKDKALIVGALGYLILPTDLIPDFLPGGYADDLSALLAVLQLVSSNVTEEIKIKAEDKVNELFSN